MRHHAVQADGPAVQVGQAGLPDLQAVALAAVFGLDDIETEKAEMIAVLHHGNDGYGFAVQQADEEAVGIGRVETVRVMQAGVPAFRRGPVDGDIDFGAGHGSDLVVGGVHESSPS
ncbi:hypothetical protein D3C86_1788160 [compost metagenome]